MRRNPDMRASLAEADALFEKGQIAEAVARLRKAAKRWPDDPLVLVTLAATLIAVDLDEAERTYAKAAELAWDDPSALVGPANGMTHVGNWDEAARLADRVEALAPEDFAFRPELDHVRAAILVAGGDHERAFPLLVSSYAGEPGYDHGRALIQTSLELEQYDNLQPVVERALQAGPDDREYLLDLRAWLTEEGFWHDDRSGGSG
jgi:tetratricopeptide (TPR) repeat protein